MSKDAFFFGCVSDNLVLGILAGTCFLLMQLCKKYQEYLIPLQANTWIIRKNAVSGLLSTYIERPIGLAVWEKNTESAAITDMAGMLFRPEVMAKI